MYGRLLLMIYKFRIFDFFNQFLAVLKGLAGNFPYVNIDAIYEHIMDLSRCKLIYIRGEYCLMKKLMAE